MQAAIERIINNDRKAREAVAAAEKHRKESADSLAEQKAEIKQKTESDLAAEIASAKERSEKKSGEEADLMKRHAEEICRKMNDRYEANKSSWIEEYTKKVIGK